MLISMAKAMAIAMAIAMSTAIINLKQISEIFTDY
jgi:hypothetical protein